MCGVRPAREHHRINARIQASAVLARRLRAPQAQSPAVIARVTEFGLFALVASMIHHYSSRVDLGIDVAPYEVAGAALGVLLVLRTNAGYERWWEGGELWGGIVNQSRNLAIGVLAFGPHDPRLAGRGHALDRRARARRPAQPARRRETAGSRRPARCRTRRHRIAARRTHAELTSTNGSPRIFRQGRDGLGLDRFSFLQIDRERAALIDHIGGCERILNTPLPQDLRHPHPAVHRPVPGDAPVRHAQEDDG